MGYWSRRELLTGAIGDAGGAGVLGYSWRWYSTRQDEIRLRPITLVNGNTDPRDVYVRIYTADGYEFHDMLTLEAAETDTANAEGSTTTRTLNGPWEEIPRRYALTVIHDARGGSYTNEDIQEEITEDDPDSNIAEVLISVNSSMFSVHITARDGNIIRWRRFGTRLEGLTSATIYAICTLSTGRYIVCTDQIGGGMVPSRRN